MALTWANVEKIYRGPRTFVYADATFDSAYASGGEAVVPVDVGLAEIHMVLVGQTAGYNATYSKTNVTSGRFAIYASSNPSTNSAVSAPLDSSIGRDYSNVTVSCVIIGR